jgi:thiamine phosphate synthase YjbQ (UPF0047 family)
MPSTSWTSSPFYQFLFLFVFILAFFPSAFQYLIKLPLLPFTYSYSQSSPSPSAPPCPSHCLSTPQPRIPPPTTQRMSWFQKSFTLPSRSRGSYLITSDVVSALPEISSYKVGLLNLFVQHTSCALSMNENWDEEVREDMSDALDRIAPEDRKGNLYRHAAEGVDDMPVRTMADIAGRTVIFYFLRFVFLGLHISVLLGLCLRNILSCSNYPHLLRAHQT